MTSAGRPLAGPAGCVGGSAHVPRNGLRPLLLLYFAAPPTHPAGPATSLVLDRGQKSAEYPTKGVRPIHSNIQRFRNHAIKGIISAQCLLSNTTKQKADPTFLKHGIEFSDAQKLWTDTELLEIPARTDDEARSLVIGRIDGKHWSAVITYRGSDIRLISVRRSRTEEVALYESQDV